MSETTFDVMKKKDEDRLKSLRSKGINAPDYTYDERIPTEAAIDLANRQDPGLIKDNQNSIVKEAKKALEKENEEEFDKTTATAEAAVIHTSTQAEKGEIDSEKAR